MPGMSTPSLSIVIPTYNMQQWLPQALESCLQQRDPDFEVIVVNDGSVDRSGDIADFYARADSRVRAIHQQNKGVGPTRQAGQELASGEFLCWLDADDFLDTDGFGNMVALARRDKVDMVCGNALAFSCKTLNARRYFPHPPASHLSFADVPAYWKSKVAWRWIFRRAFVENHNFRYPAFKYSQDVCFMFEALCAVDRFSQYAGTAYYFRQDHKSDGLTLDVWIDHQLRHFLTVKKILLEHGRIKPLIKYLQENWYRDILKILPRPDCDEAVRTRRVLPLCLELFDGLDPHWFTPVFLAPEVRADPAVRSLAERLIQGDAVAVEEKFRHLASAETSRDRSSRFHTLRRTLKAFVNPLSWQVRSRLVTVRQAARRRLEPEGLWFGE